MTKLEMQVATDEEIDTAIEQAWKLIHQQIGKEAFENWRQLAVEQARRDALRKRQGEGQ